MARDHEGALSYDQWPSDWKETGKRALRGADPLRDAIAEAIEELVEPGLVVAQGQEYQDGDGNMVTSAANVVDCIKRMDLKKPIEDSARKKGAIKGRSNAETIKKHMDAVMASKGFELQEDQTIHNQRVITAYLGCRMKHDCY